MARLVLRGLLTRKLRSALTAIAILLGVAMIAGTFVYTDQIKSGFNDIFATANRGIDAVVLRKSEFTSQNGGLLDPLDESLVARVRGVDGVKEAVGQVDALGSLVVNGKEVKTAGGAPPLVFSNLPPELSASTIVNGHFPERSGEIAVIEQVANDKNLHVGQRVGLATEVGVKPVTIAGIFKFGNAPSIGGATVTVTTLADAQHWFNREGKVDEIDVKADQGVSAAEVARRIQAVVPASAEVRTGQQNAQKQAKDINDAIGGFLTPALLAFGAVAVLVGAFIIFNTFSITVAQRVREFGLFRTIGASRRQVLWSVVGEAFVVGIVASVVGLGAGVGIAKLIGSAFKAAGFGLPLAGIMLKPRTVVIALLVGIVVTLAAALLPAVRATRVPPVAALREGAELPRSRFARFTPYVAGVVSLIGIYLLLQGVFGSGGTTSRLLTMAIGAVVIFIGVAMVGRYIVAPLARVVGWPIEHLRRGPGRIARENALRNPGRTATTAAALMIGVGLVVFVTVFAQGLKDSFTAAIDRTVKGDLIITTSGARNLPAASVDAVRGTSGVAAVVPVQSSEVRVNGGGTESINAIDPARATGVISFDWRKGGSQALLGQLGTDGAIVEQDLAQSRNLTPGTSFRVTTASGQNARFRVIGQYKDPQLFTGFTVSSAAYDRLYTDRGPQVIIAKDAPGSEAKVVQADVTRALASYPDAEVRSNAQYKAQVEDQVNQLVYVLYALLALSVIISLFGIVNTLILSIYERTREIGMLRAIGTTRSQVRSIIRYESVITASIGGILGIAVGILFGWIMAKGLESEGIVFSVPVPQLIAFMILAIIAGVLAAILPARRAARLRVLDALHYE